MMKLKYTKRAKILYGVSTALYLLSLGLLITLHERVGMILLCVALNLTVTTALANGHMVMPKWWRK